MTQEPSTPPDDSRLYHTCQSEEDDNGRSTVYLIRKDSSEGAEHDKLNTDSERRAYIVEHAHRTYGQQKAQWHFVTEGSRQWLMRTNSPESRELSTLKDKEDQKNFIIAHAHRIRDLDPADDRWVDRLL
ncbi:MAG: hypothetical protein M1822_008174 [Bathelium mastoideum]|nr:MAG: hypothetical protein M1822_008174 [Bathelium mastoideum]